MECERIRKKFSFLLEGELDPSEEKIVREHLASCCECQRDFEAFKKTINWLHSVEEVEAPQGFLTEIYQKMEDRKGVGYRKEWVHRLMRLKLPAQAVGMVAIVFAVLYITKMIPVETPLKKDADVTRALRSEVKTEAHLAQKEANREKQEIALPSEAPRRKETEQERTSRPGEKKVEKGTVQREKEEARGPVAYFPKAGASQTKDTEKAGSPPSEPGKIKKGATLTRRAPVGAEPSREIILRVSDQEKAVFQLQGLVEEFGGKIIREEGHILLASLPSVSYSQFEKKLEGMTTPKKAEPAAPQQVAPRALKMDSRAKEEESAGKGKELRRSTADQPSCITIRILLIKE
jgi:hypothetical protein